MGKNNRTKKGKNANKRRVSQVLIPSKENPPSSQQQPPSKRIGDGAQQRSSKPNEFCGWGSQSRPDDVCGSGDSSAVVARSRSIDADEAVLQNFEESISMYAKKCSKLQTRFREDIDFLKRFCMEASLATVRSADFLTVMGSMMESWNAALVTIDDTISQDAEDLKDYRESMKIRKPSSSSSGKDQTKEKTEAEVLERIKLRHDALDNALKDIMISFKSSEFSAIQEKIVQK